MYHSSGSSQKQSSERNVGMRARLQSSTEWELGWTAFMLHSGKKKIYRGCLWPDILGKTELTNCKLMGWFTWQRSTGSLAFILCDGYCSLCVWSGLQWGFKGNSGKGCEKIQFAAERNMSKTDEAVWLWLLKRLVEPWKYNKLCHESTAKHCTRRAGPYPMTALGQTPQSHFQTFFQKSMSENMSLWATWFICGHLEATVAADQGGRGIHL